MNFHLAQEHPTRSELAKPTLMVAGKFGASWTRTVLSFSARQKPILGVIGWVDISSPNLVDLLDDLTTGDGGPKLTGLRLTQIGPINDPLPIERGIATIDEFHLSIWVNRGEEGAKLKHTFPHSTYKTLPLIAK